MKLCKYRILSIMFRWVRVTIVLLTLNIIAIWITPNRKKDMSIIKLILIRWEDNCLTGQKNSWYKTKASQLMNYGILLNLNFMKNGISLFQNNWVEFHHWKLRVACQLIKSFVILYGTKVSYTGDRHHQKMLQMSQMLKMFDEHTPKPETKLKQ